MKSGFLKWAVPLGLLLATLVAYAPALRGAFIWDDDYYVVNNAALRSLDGLQRIWVSVFDFASSPVPQYYPMTFTSLWIDYHLWGLNPAGYHVMNVILHALSAWALWAILRRLAIPGATLAAFVFALHPLHVESVAWITERKNVLSGLFALTSLLVYLQYLSTRVSPPPSTLGGGAGEGLPGVDTQSALPPTPSQSTGRGSDGDYQLELPREPWKLYALSLLLFAFALFSKTVTATLPGVILVIIWWQRGRLTSRDFVPLIPFIVIGIVLSAVTGYIEREYVGALGADWDYTIAQRLLIAGRAAWFYVGKLFAPIGLAFMYEKWNVDAAHAVQWLAPLAVAAALATAIALIGRLGRAPLAILLIFGGTLLPALGFVNFLPMRYSLVANHFAYLPSIALIVGACAAATVAMRNIPNAARFAAAAIVCVGLAAATFAHARIYKNPETLWTDTTIRSPKSWIGHNNLGALLFAQKRYDEAEPALQHALDLKKTHVEAPLNLGRIAEARGNRPLAAQYYELSIFNAAKSQELDEKVTGRPVRRRIYAHPMIQLANLKLEDGDLAGAEKWYAYAVQQDERSVVALTCLGEVRRRMGKTSEALDLQTRAMQMDPTSSQVRLNLGNVLLAMGKLDDAMREYGLALELDRSNAVAANNLGLIFAATKRYDQAIEMFQHALKLKPDYKDAQQNVEAARRRAASQPATKPG